MKSRGWRVSESRPVGAPDSPVNYSGVASGNSRRWRVCVGVLWCTGHVRCARPEVPSVDPFALLSNPTLGLFIG
jgi:hypothetical protein